MAFSTRWQLVGTTATALTLAFAACGDEKKEEAEPRDQGGGSIEALFDGGLDVLADLDDNVAGSVCTLNEDCKGKNAVCSVRTIDGRGACSGACVEDGNCGVGGKCVTVASFGDTNLSFCAKTCSSDDQCDSELECRKTVDLRGALDSVFEVVSGIIDGGVEGLTAEDTPQICQEKAGTVNLANGTAGKACTAANAASVCGSGTCETALNPGGYCTGMCFQDSDCGNGGGCARDALSATLGEPGSCRATCSTDDDCRSAEGYTCTTLEIAFGPGSYCVYTPTFDGGFPGFGDGGFAFPGAGDAGSAATDAGTPAPTGDQ